MEPVVNKASHKMGLGIYLVFLLLVSGYCYLRPLYNWDILPYMGVILSYEEPAGTGIHDKAYATAKEQLPTAIYAQLTDTSNQHRKAVTQSAEEFNLQLPFYVVKPLYTGMGYLFYKLHIPLLKATVIPSVLAYFLIGLLVFYWLGLYLRPFFAVAGGMLVMLSGPLLEVARSSSPDALSALLLLAAMFVMLEKKQLLWAFVLLLLALFARLDNMVAILLLVPLLTWSRQFSAGKKPLSGIICMVVAIISYLFIASGSGKYGWNLLYFTSFVSHINSAHDIHAAFSFREYLTVVKTQIFSGLFFSHICLFLLLMLLLFADIKKLRFPALTDNQLLALAIVAIMLARFALLPVIADRFYVAYYIVILILLIRSRLATSSS